MPANNDDLERAILEHTSAARAERRYRERTTGRSGVIASLTFGAVLLAVNGALVWLIAQGVMSQTTAAYVIPTITLLLFFGGLIMILRWQAKAKRQEQDGHEGFPLEANAAVQARSAFTSGNPSPAIQPGSSALEQAERAAALTRFAEPRLSTQWYTRRSVAQTETFYAAVLLGPLLLGACVASAAALDAAKPLLPAEGWALAALWVAVFVGGIVVLALRHRRQQRTLRREQSFAALAASLPNALVLDHEGVVEWLNGHWPATTPPEDSHVGLSNCAVAAVLHGYPILIEVEPEGRSDEYVTFEPRALVYCCALVSEHTRTDAAIATIAATLANIDFSLECAARAGFIARAGASAIVPCKADPPALSQLAFVAQQLLHTPQARGIPAPRLLSDN